MRGSLLVILAGAAFASPWVQTPREAVTFGKQIGPLLARKCVPCHRPGGSAPFSLTSYADAKKRAELIKDVGILRTMPPGDAYSDLGRIPLQDPLTDGEVVLLQRWVQQKMPAGPRYQAATPKLPVWRGGQPDMTVRLPRSESIRPGGGPVWVAYRIPNALKSGGYVTGFDVRPSSRLAVRHVLVALPQSGSVGVMGRTGGSLRVPGDVILGAWAPGYPMWKAPAGFGKRVAAGTSLLVQVQYQPTGKLESGGIELGLYLAKQARPVDAVTLGNKSFVIPPSGADVIDTVLTSSYKLKQDSTVFSMHPEARRFATHVRLVATLPSRAKRSVFEIRRWDVSKLGAYTFQEPVRLPKGTTLTAEFSYDNSSHDPGVRKVLPPIRFGYGDKNELFWLHIQLAVASR
jgi:hypothetical protein